MRRILEYFELIICYSVVFISENISFFLMLNYFINEMILGILHKLAYWTSECQTFFNKTKILNCKILASVFYIWSLTTTVNVFFDYYNVTSLPEDFHSLLFFFFFIINFIFIFFSPLFPSRLNIFFSSNF